MSTSAAEWRKAKTEQYMSGATCKSVWLKTFRENEHNTGWRSVSQIEDMCCYITALENRLAASKEKS